MIFAGVSRVCELSSLRRLEIEASSASDDGFSNLWCLSQLEELRVQGYNKDNHSTHDNNGDRNLDNQSMLLFNVSMLHNLRSLYLRGTGVKDSGLVHLTSLPSLTSLALWSCNNVSDDGLKHVSNMTTLRNLEVGYLCFKKETFNS